MIVLLVVALLVGACSAGPRSNPSMSVGESDLAGLWKSVYRRVGTDTIEVRGDGTFRQEFRHSSGGVSETGWNRWWLERFSDGRIRVHFLGAHYYAEGLSFVDRADWSFWDPVGESVVRMSGELIMNVRADPSGRLYLHHMWLSAHGGYPILEQDSLELRRVE